MHHPVQNPCLPWDPQKADESINQSARCGSHSSLFQPMERLSAPQPGCHWILRTRDGFLKSTAHGCHLFLFLRCRSSCAWPTMALRLMVRGRRSQKCQWQVAAPVLRLLSWPSASTANADLILKKNPSRMFAHWCFQGNSRPSIFYIQCMTLLKKWCLLSLHNLARIMCTGCKSKRPEAGGMVWAVGKCLERVWCHGIHSNVPNQSAGTMVALKKGKCVTWHCCIARSLSRPLWHHRKILRTSGRLQLHLCTLLHYCTMYVFM